MGREKKEQMRFAQLDEERLEKLRALEDKLDATVLAFEPMVALADLEQSEIEQLKAMERELGVVLLAYKQAI